MCYTGCLMLIVNIKMLSVIKICFIICFRYRDLDKENKIIKYFDNYIGLFDLTYNILKIQTLFYQLFI